MSTKAIRSPVHSADSSATRRAWATPIALWALVGTAFLVSFAWIAGRYIAAGAVHPTHSPAYHISSTRSVMIWAWQGIVVITAIGIIAILVRQCRRERRITFDTAFYIAMLFASFLGPALNYSGRALVTSHYAINLNSWGAYIPGWHGGDAQQQPLVFFAADGLAWGLMILWLWGGRWFLDRLCPPDRRWRPLTLAAVALAVLTVLDVIFEQLWILTGAWAYGAKDLPGPVLFSGHWYQMPVLDGLLLGVWSAVFVLMDRFARDRNREVALFRGSDLLPARAIPFARILAVTGLSCLATVVWMGAFALAFTPGSGGLNPDLPSHLLPH